MRSKKLVVGNWKMHGSRPANAELLSGLLAARPFTTDVAVCVPFVYLPDTALALAASDIRWGAQDVSSHEQGAFTGEVSAAMLAECGCRYAIVGHSERRAYHGESDLLVAEKAQAALGKGITPIVCVGETLAEREANRDEEVIDAQLAASLPDAFAASGGVIAYEPVWAIGTGKVATPKQANEVHHRIRKLLVALFGPAGSSIRVIYGGSVKPENAAELMAEPDIDGALVGGASLDARSFFDIIEAARPVRASKND